MTVGQIGEVQAQATATSPSKLVKSAREFETILLQGWLEKMNHSFVGESNDSDAAHDTISSLGTQAIAFALAERGGIGIASMLIQQFHAQVTNESPAQPVGTHGRVNSADQCEEARNPGHNIKVFSRCADH